MKIFVFFLLFAFAEPLKLENVEFSTLADNFVQAKDISIKKIIDGLISNFQGYKKTNLSLIEIDPGNRFEDIIIESDLANVTNDMDDGLRNIKIRNLTFPLSKLKVEGRYSFEELNLFDLLIYGQGDVVVDITELRIFLSMTAKYSSLRGWIVSDIEIDTSVKDSLIRLNNLMNGEPMGDFLNFMIDQLFKVGIDLLNGLVNEHKEFVKKIIKEFLDNLMKFEI